MTRLNGVEKTSVVVNTVPTNDTFTLCAELDSGGSRGNFLQANVGEVLMYDRVLNANETSTVENYLSNKWGVPLV